jgi:hypothetical protein
MTRAEAAQLLSEAGLLVVEDSGIGEWRQRYIVNASRPPTGFHERIMVGESDRLPNASR